MRIPVKYRTDSGSILITVLAILMFAGVFLTFGIDFFKIQTPAERRMKTQRDMEFISHQLAAYAQRAHYLPCPAKPEYLPNAPEFGQMMFNSGGDDKCQTYHGILPVRNLGIPDEYMKDGWGNYYTYSLSPAFWRENDSNNVYHECRTSRWVKNDGTDYNTNLAKARFCCPGIDKYPPVMDLVVDDITGLTFSRSSDASDYAPADTLAAGSPSSAGEAIAYVLVSHGSDGMGAFHEGMLVRDLTGLASSQLENANDDDKFIRTYMNPSQDTDYFDDMVLYKTQYQIEAELGAGSCTSAYFSY